MRKYTTAVNRVIVRTAEEAKKYAVIRKVLLALLICLVTLSSIVYIISVLYSKYGSFTVSVDKYDLNKYNLCLSETEKFDNKTARLNAKTALEITNISGDDLPGDVDSINGVHNGENYLAYTFHLKNVGKDTVTLQYHLFIANITNHLDTAIRIRVYRDGNPITYARTASDGSGAEPGTTEFLTARDVLREQITKFKPDDVTKFTIVIWIEGDDPDCTDDLIGGTLKSDMIISVIESNSDSKQKK